LINSIDNSLYHDIIIGYSEFFCYKTLTNGDLKMKKFIAVLLLMFATTSLYAGDVDNFVEAGADVMFYDDFSTSTNLDTPT